MHFTVDGAVHGQVEAIQRIAVVHAEHLRHIVAHLVDRLARHPGRRIGPLRRGCLVQRLRQRRVAQLRRDGVGRRQQPQVAAGQCVQVGIVAPQVIRGPALRDDQRQRALVCLGLARGGAARVHVADQRVDFAEVLAVPDVQPVTNAVDLAMSHARGERHRVQVVEHDVFAGALGIGAVDIGAQRGRGHLAELVRN
ncbi:hypothetical protein D3C86_1370970 [compost metagenome]